MRPPIRFHLDERKATAVAAVLLKKDRERRMDCLRLMKLLYIVERESLSRRGLPVIGDNYLSMKRGPVLGGLSLLLKADAQDLDERSFLVQHISRDGDFAILVKDPGTDWLSDFEIELLDEIFEKFGHMSPDELVDFTHTFSEWRNPGESSRLDISPEQILSATGRGPEEIEAIAKVTAEANAFDEILQCHRS